MRCCRTSRVCRRKRTALELIKKSTSVDRGELSLAFAAVRSVNQRADTLRLGITVGGVVVVALLAFWGGGGMLQAVGDLSHGLRRFGTGDFDTPIPVRSRDELSMVAEQANQMAASLARLSAAREADDWLKTGLSGLNEQLRGELEPRALAEGALTYLADRVGALAGALYLRQDDRAIVLEAAYAGGSSVRDVAVGARFGEGEGLVGRALASGELAQIDDLPPDYLVIKSGLGQASPKQLLLLPLVHFGRKQGVLELALFKPASASARELLLAARAPLVITIEAARSSRARRKLLQATQLKPSG